MVWAFSKLKTNNNLIKNNMLSSEQLYSMHSCRMWLRRTIVKWNGWEQWAPIEGHAHSRYVWCSMTWPPLPQFIIEMIDFDFGRRYTRHFSLSIAVIDEWKQIYIWMAWPTCNPITIIICRKVSYLTLIIVILSKRKLNAYEMDVYDLFCEIRQFAIDLLI